MIRFTERQAKYAARLLAEAERELRERRVNLCYSRDYFRWARNHGYKDWMIDSIRALDKLRAELAALAGLLAGVAPDPYLEPAANPDPVWGGGEQRELAAQPCFTSAAGWWED